MAANTNTQDYSKVMRDMMGMFPMDMSAMQNSFRTYASFGEKLSGVALVAAEKSNEISSKWTSETLSRMGEAARVKEDPQDYGRAVTDFASSQAEMTAESIAAFAEIAKRVQMETVELMLAAGKDMSEDATSVMKKATSDVTAGTKKAANKAA